MINSHKIKSTLRVLKYYKKNSLFYKIFIMVIIAILIIIVFNYSIIIYIKKNAENNEIETQQIMLGNSHLYIDNSFDKIRKNADTLKLDKDIISFMNFTSKGGSAYDNKIDNIKTRLSNIRMNMSEINDIYLYSMGMDTILGAEGISHPYTYYKNRYLGDFDEWKEEMLKNTTSVIKITKDEFNTSKIKQIQAGGISVVNIIEPVYHNRICLGLIVINIKNDFLEKNVINDDPVSSRKIFIVNEEREIIGKDKADDYGIKLQTDIELQDAANQRVQFNGEEHLIYTKKSAIYNIYYIILTPLNSITKHINSLITVSKIFLAVALLIGIGFSFFISLKLYVPIGNVVEILGNYPITKEGQGKNEIDFIQNNFINIIALNSNLKDAITESLPLITEVIFQKLIIGGEDGADAIKISQQYDIEFKEGYYYISVIKTNYIRTENFDVYILLKQFLSDYMVNIIKMKNDEITVVMYDQGGIDPNILISEYQKLLDIVNNIKGVSYCYIGLGLPVKDVLQIKKSYNQARAAINSRRAKDKFKIINYNTCLEKEVARFVMPNDMEQRLITYILSGNTEESIKYANKILGNNLTTDLPFSVYYGICSCIQSVILRLISDWPNQENFDRKNEIEKIGSIQEELNLDGLKLKILNNITALTQYYSKINDNFRKFDEMLEYLKENYNNDINLEVLANKFDVNPSYFSKVFKQRKGVNFTNYLNSIKTEKAKMLLKETNLKIEDIALQVGYSSANVFVRTFKKYEGVSPGKYGKRNLE